jgi:multidrug resistance protein
VTNLSVALYMLSISFFPLWWASFSETSGRRTVYISSFILYVVFAILCAVAKSISVFVAMRMLCGGAGAAVQAVGAGTLADMWEPFERGKAMSLFYLGPLTGPLTAPIIGGFLSQRWGWRSTQWFLVIWGGVAFVLLLFTLPETLKGRKTIVNVAEEEVESLPLGRVSSNTSVTRVRTKKLLFILRRLFVDPLKIVLNLRYPAILFTSYFAALAFGSLYVINISLQDVFAKSPYNFDVSKIGLVYIPSGFGFLISALFAGKWADVIMAREARRKSRYDASGKLVVMPEDRMMENAWLAAVGFPASMVVYGWTADKGVFWVVPVGAPFVRFACFASSLSNRSFHPLSTPSSYAHPPAHTPVSASGSANHFPHRCSQTLFSASQPCSSSPSP